MKFPSGLDWSSYGVGDRGDTHRIVYLGLRSEALQSMGTAFILLRRKETSRWASGYNYLTPTMLKAH